MLRWRPCRASGDDGSLVVAMGVMMVITFLSVAVLARSLASLANVRRVQAGEAALAAAESGLSDALFAIDQADGEADSITGSGTGFTWAATPDGSDYTVRVEATAEGVSTSVVARLVRSSEGKWPFAVFTQQDLVLDDGTGDRPPLLASGARVGSNRSVSVRGTPADGEQWFYTPAGSCTNCPDGAQQAGPRVIDDPVQPVGASACPVDGNGRVRSPLVGGTYACTSDISFEDDITVQASPDDPVEIWVGSGADVDLHDLQLHGVDDARELLVLKAGSGSVCAGDVADGALGVCDHTQDDPTVFTGVIYAPSADLAVSGQSLAIVGSVTVNSIGVADLDEDEQGALAVVYDDALASVPATDWQVCAWQQIPADAATPALAC